MSRVIKSAILHGTPKIVENPAFPLAEQAEKADDNLNQESRLSTAVACSVMLEENRRKAANILAEAENQRNLIMAEAKQQAEDILARTEQQSAEIKLSTYEESKEKGYREGHESGCVAAQEDMKALLNAANEKAEKIIRLAENDTKDTVLDAESKIVAIALAIADRVIPQHFIDVPQVILPLIKAALNKVKDQKSIVIHVSPDNYEFVLMAKKELQMILEGEGDLMITADQMLNNDGCVVESANGNVDARLETQLAIIKKAVQEVMQ